MATIQAEIVPAQVTVAGRSTGPEDPATVVQIFPAIQSFNLLFGNAPT